MCRKEAVYVSEKQHILGSEEHQAWLRDYFFAPRGIGFTEPGTVGLDSAQFSAYNVAKSFYQNYPEVFNISVIAGKTGGNRRKLSAGLKDCMMSTSLCLL